MPELNIDSNPDAAQKNGVINPYALAEYIAGRKIPWDKLESTPKLLESILQTPYEELFDPKYEGPLYTGLKLNKKGTLERVHSPLLDVEVQVGVNDLEMPVENLLTEVKYLSDLGSRYNVENVGTLAVHSIDLCDPYQISLTIRLPEKDRLQSLARVFTKAIVKSIAYDPNVQGNANEDWTPANASWVDKGTFFNETAEFFDPVQGAVANCYYIAALSSVAWATPYQIKHLTRATGQGQDQFTNLIRFYNPDSNGQVDKEIEVTDTVPVNSATGNFIYCRSSESGEIWPAVYEKAFAKLETGTTTDHPDITATGWGDCVYATAQLNGASRYYYGNDGLTGDELWDLVRSNSMSKRTFNPMTCWTYGSAPEGLSYSDANIVGSHCYSVLGWDYYCGKKYIVLRNPWGSTEATVGTRSGVVTMYDISWWRPIELANPDGTFAIEANSFKQYFAGIGVAR
jgi:hypothetical protein